MPLPTKANLEALDYTCRGLPFAQVEAKPLSAGTLDLTWRGLPFYAALAGFQPAWARNANTMIGAAVHAA